MEEQKFFTLWYVKALVVLILIGVVLALGAYTKATLREAKYGQYGFASLNVQGTAEVIAKPDIGQFTFSVLAEAADAATAQSDSATKINNILSYLKEAGIDESDIKTTNYYLSPKYSYEERVCLSGTSYCPPGERYIDGYQVTQSVSVKVRDLDTAGNLISGVGERGATNVSQLQFTIDDESSLKAEARAKAIADAREKAEDLADSLGVKITRFVSYYEDNQGYYGYEAKSELSYMSFDGGGDAVAPNLPTGENTIISNVNVTFEVE